MEHIADKSILLTRSEADNGPWTERLISLGAKPIPIPCIEIKPLPLADAWVNDLSRMSWVAFTSHRAVLLFARQLDEGNLANIQIAAVGQSTKAACVDKFGRCDLTAKDGTAASLAEALGRKLVPGACVLIPGAAEPRPELSLAVEAAGGEVTNLPLYVTTPAQSDELKAEFTSATLDAALFASPSAVTGCLSLCSMPQDTPAACIGPTTASAANDAGMTNIVIAETRGLDGLLRALRTPLTQTQANR